MGGGGGGGEGPATYFVKFVLLNITKSSPKQGPPATLYLPLASKHNHNQSQLEQPYITAVYREVTGLFNFVFV